MAPGRVDLPITDLRASDCPLYLRPPADPVGQKVKCLVSHGLQLMTQLLVSWALQWENLYSGGNTERALQYEFSCGSEPQFFL